MHLWFLRVWNFWYINHILYSKEKNWRLVKIKQEINPIKIAMFFYFTFQQKQRYDQNNFVNGLDRYNALYYFKSFESERILFIYLFIGIGLCCTRDIISSRAISHLRWGFYSGQSFIYIFHKFRSEREYAHHNIVMKKR